MSAHGMYLRVKKNKLMKSKLFLFSLLFCTNYQEFLSYYKCHIAEDYAGYISLHLVRFCPIFKEFSIIFLLFPVLLLYAWILKF